MLFWLPQGTGGGQELPLTFKILFFLALLAPLGLLTAAVIGWYTEIIEDVQKLKWPRELRLLAIYVIKAVSYVSIVAIWLGVLFACLWELGKSNRDYGNLIVPSEPATYNALDRKIFSKHSEALEETTRRVRVKHDKAHSKLSTLGPKIIQFLKFDTNSPSAARLQRNPLFAVAVIDYGRVDQAPRAGFFVNSEPYKIKDSHFFVGKVHHVNTPTFNIQREGSREGDSRKAIRSVFGSHNLKGLLSDLDHLVSLQGHRGGSQKHEELDASVEQLHSLSLASASELDRILLEGLRAEPRDRGRA